MSYFCGISFTVVGVNLFFKYKVCSMFTLLQDLLNFTLTDFNEAKPARAAYQVAALPKVSVGHLVRIIELGEYGFVHM